MSWPMATSARELGFPTTNINVPDEICLPADGVYAGWYLTPDGTRRPTAISLGRRPDLLRRPAVLAARHLLDFQGDLYGQTARLQLVELLRPAKTQVRLSRHARSSRSASTAPRPDACWPPHPDGAG